MAAQALQGIRIDTHLAGERGWRDSLRAHLLRLKPDARFNRFFGAANDAAVVRYVAEASPALVVDAVENDAVVGVAEQISAGRPKARASA